MDSKIAAHLLRIMLAFNNYVREKDLVIIV
jgi:hypothetical protein